MSNKPAALKNLLEEDRNENSKDLFNTWDRKSDKPMFAKSSAKSFASLQSTTTDTKDGAINRRLSVQPIRTDFNVCHQNYMHSLENYQRRKKLVSTRISLLPTRTTSVDGGL